MITRDQVYAMLLFRSKDNIFSVLSKDWIRYISDMNDGPDSEINVALGLAASGLKEDIAKLVEMVKTNPRLLLQAGNVVTRGGVSVTRTTLYEFFLGEGDPVAAKQIEFGFAQIPNGDNQRLLQYERYRPHIEALAKKVESKQPEFDLRPLFKIIKESPAPDITEALNINDLNRTVTHNTPLRASLAQFRKAVKPKKSISVGMHYEYYTTLQQAFDLLDSEWQALSDNNTNDDKCCLVWLQIIGYLQLGLPAVDRFAFARAFDDTERTLNFKYENGSSFPDVISTDGDLDLSGLGFDVAIVGGMVCADDYFLGGRSGRRELFGSSMSSKNFKLAELMPRQPEPKPSACVIC